MSLISRQPIGCRLTPGAQRRRRRPFRGWASDVTVRKLRSAACLTIHFRNGCISGWARSDGMSASDRSSVRLSKVAWICLWQGLHSGTRCSARPPRDLGVRWCSVMSRFGTSRSHNAQIDSASLTPHYSGLNDSRAVRYRCNASRQPGIGRCVNCSYGVTSRTL